MAESWIKIRATVNEIYKHFEECPSSLFYIKWYSSEYDGIEHYKGNDNATITFKVLLRHNEIGNRSIERKSSYTLESVEQTLYEKVKEHIKEQISEIEEKYMKLNNIEESENISKIINNCAFVLDGIDIRNKENNNQEEYPEWATKENIELIENWSYYQKELNNMSSNNEKVYEKDIDIEY